MMLSLTFLGMIGAPQIILIIAVVLLLFGGRKIPELMRGLGSGIKEFKNATKEEENPKVEKRMFEHMKTNQYNTFQQIQSLQGQLSPIITFVQNLQKQLEEEETDK